MATPRETAFDGTVVPGAKRAMAYLDTKTSHVAGQTAARPVRRGGKDISWIQETADTKTIAMKNQTALAALSAKVDGLVGAIAALNTGEKFDEAKLLASIEEATKRGIAAAIDTVTREEVTVVEFKDLGELEEGVPAEEVTQ